ncbi:NAD-dependent dehydratase [Edaphobacter acidisoli]|uniref:NAD-dependent dehydratase n=1 Tax=Edaphobacter acidisoli TaxID=2040573 RepID=A0A916W8R4_9BACT|nr:SDR family oxidoreductase [Edaphobacter acidisoli]GGA77517.1 NAD-dependent dehydratase [Edaphobacter acidisoli]
MKVFVTGATGFIGSAVVLELIDSGHQVLGLTRSDAGAQSLAAAGAQVHRGELEDIQSLRSGAEAADAVIHTAFNHDFSKFKENCELDRHAIEAIGAVLKGSERPLIVTSGVAALAEGRAATEDDPPHPVSDSYPRASEPVALELLQQGVRASVMRLPQVHDTTRQGLVSYLIQLAREKGASAYIDAGLNRWAAVHRLDVARLYRLALEKNVAGARYHAVAEEDVPLRDIAEAIGRGLNVPTVSIAPDTAANHFGWLGAFAGMDLWASGAKTQHRLKWNPTGPSLISDLNNMQYHQL